MTNLLTTTLMAAAAENNIATTNTTSEVNPWSVVVAIVIIVLAILGVAIYAKKNIVTAPTEDSCSENQEVKTEKPQPKKEVIRPVPVKKASKESLLTTEELLKAAVLAKVDHDKVITIAKIFPDWGILLSLSDKDSEPQKIALADVQEFITTDGSTLYSSKDSKSMLSITPDGEFRLFDGGEFYSSASSNLMLGVAKLSLPVGSRLKTIDDKYIGKFVTLNNQDMIVEVEGRYEVLKLDTINCISVEDTMFAIVGYGPYLVMVDGESKAIQVFDRYGKSIAM